MPSGKILFIDAYDSFSNSIIALLKSELDVSVEVVRIDDARFVLNDKAFFRFLDEFDAVVAGPGPGHPANPGDVGLIGRLWHLPDNHVLPVLGICLGFQSLCYSFGGRVSRLKEPRHGIVTVMTHCGKDIFADTGKIVTTQYHSLHVQLVKEPQQQEDYHVVRSSPADGEHLVPLAWDLLNTVNGPTLMAARHRINPFWGVQYHPESVCTNEAGRKLVTNWWREVWDWNCAFDRHVRLPRRMLHQDAKRRKSSAVLSSATSQTEVACSRSVQYSRVELSQDVDVANIAHILSIGNPDLRPLLLESGTRNGKLVNAETGRFSIIGLRDSSSLQLRYYSATSQLAFEQNGDSATILQGNIRDTLDHLDRIVRDAKASGGPQVSPFWGGLVGFISYEACLETIDIAPSGSEHLRPDSWFVFIDRSIVVDHDESVAYVQSIREDDADWIHSTAKEVQNLSRNQIPNSSSLATDFKTGKVSSQPQREDYSRKIQACQSKLRAGESYELCLTDQTRVTSSTEPWSLYCHLRKRNPAPFSSFLHLSSASQPGVSVVSCSPERFLSWTRQGRCQFRPIKGTVKKTPGMTRTRAESILGSAKERAENLMIVDLIRHDLSGVEGIGPVSVPKLMVVEEYETVFQLVSVIEGSLGSATSPIAALAASLPPGSMTGAPKKRSCELLKVLEDEQPRGLYSGVIGYFDVGGGGDFSVVIRTAYKWDDGDSDWSIGAGGAVIALSDAEAEWQEMLAKRQSVLDWMV